MNTLSPEKSIVIFGAGKIGRSFIGQLFSLSGYKVIFIDVNLRIINELNRCRKYKVIIKSENEEIIEITNVCGISANDQQEVIHAIAHCSLMATCVGKNALSKILPLVAKEIENRDPLLVYAEPYNTLILDKCGFKNPIPQVIGLSPKENIKAWVDRKAFIHNLGHVAAAYLGFFRFPERKYLYEVLEDTEVYSFVREAMDQSACALFAEYPDVFTINELDMHVDDLIYRFRNKVLGDSVFRIGSDLKRKLGGDDRIVGAIKLARKHECSYNRLLDVLIYGLLFRAKDESGQLFKEDLDFIHNLELDLDNALTSVCGLDSQTDMDLVLKIKNKYEFLLKSK